jgi:hypothetical protein
LLIDVFERRDVITSFIRAFSSAHFDTYFQRTPMKFTGIPALQVSDSVHHRTELLISDVNSLCILIAQVEAMKQLTALVLPI